MAACPTRFERAHPDTGQIHEIYICPTEEALHRAVVEDFRAAVEATLSAYEDFHAVLAGGRTPRGAYALLAQEGRDLPWERIHLYWSDERAVPPDHPDSNYRMVREALLDFVPIPPENVHRIPGEQPPERAAEHYEAVLAHLPRPFDWVLLGLGSDGHTASLFPGTEAVHETRRRAMAVYAPSQKQWRITLTPPVFNAAARVRFLVTGEAKAQAIRAVIAGPYQPDQWPAQILHPPQPIRWFLDARAAFLLRAPSL